MVFNSSSYVLGSHVVKRWEERIGKNKQNLLSVVQSGEVLLDVGKHRYVKNGKLFFPCVQLKENIYKVKTVMTWDMIESRFKSAILKHYVK